MLWSTRLCASSRSAESKTLPQRLQRCCLGALEPAAAVDITIFGCYTLLRMNLSSLMKTPNAKSAVRNGFMAERRKCIAEEGTIDVLPSAVVVQGLVSEQVEIDWEEFEKFVRANCNKRTTAERVRYAKRFHYIVTTPEGPSKIRTDILQLNQDSRQSVMKALANLTKYMGVYEEWKKLQKQFGLKWTTFSPEAEASYFQETFYNDATNFTNMLNWIKRVRSRIPADVAAVQAMYLDYLSLRLEKLRVPFKYYRGL